jgi:glycosyltransferase involved in cell wall biosynthesis
MEPDTRNYPKISIITPVWNGLPYIKDCVESVVTQDFAGWEWLIGDNCSTDGTREYLESLSDPRIRLTKHPSNLGIYGNLNELFRAAKAPIAHLVGADDFLLKNALKIVIKTWKELDERVALIRFNWTEERDAKSSFRQHSFQRIPKLITAGAADAYFFTFGNFMGNLSSVSVRPEAVLLSGGCRLDLPYAGDFEIWSRIGTKWDIKISEEQTTFVRRHEKVASNYLNVRGELVDEQRVIVRQLGDRLRASGHSEFWLKLHATLLYDIFHRHCGVRALLAGKGLTYLRRVQSAARTPGITFSNFVAWILYFSTCTGRWFRKFTSNRILSRLP